jgi:hypothetical protein
MVVPAATAQKAVSVFLAHSGFSNAALNRSLLRKQSVAKKLAIHPK